MRAPTVCREGAARVTQPVGAEHSPTLHMAQIDFEDTVEDTAVNPDKATSKWIFPDPTHIGMTDRQQTPLNHLADVVVQATIPALFTRQAF